MRSILKMQMHEKNMQRDTEQRQKDMEHKSFMNGLKHYDRKT